MKYAGVSIPSNDHLSLSCKNIILKAVFGKMIHKDKISRCNTLGFGVSDINAGNLRPRNELLQLLTGPHMKPAQNQRQSLTGTFFSASYPIRGAIMEFTSMLH